MVVVSLSRGLFRAVVVVMVLGEIERRLGQIYSLTTWLTYIVCH